MLTVIGKDPNTAKKATCYSCGSIVEYHKIDVKVLWSGTDYGGGPDGAEGFSCPCCSENVIIKRW